VHGQHMGWYTVDQFVERLRADLGHTVARATAGDWMTRERNALNAKNVGMPPKMRALMEKPDVPRMMAEMKAAREELRAMDVEPADAGLLAPWYDELVAKVKPFLPLPGFGPHVVCTLGQRLYADRTAGEMWTPSDSWARWFMKNKMDLVMRRVTGSAVTPAAVQKQEELHDHNLNVIALLLEEGLKPEAIWFYDEIGERALRCATAVQHIFNSLRVALYVTSQGATFCLSEDGRGLQRAQSTWRVP